MWIWVAAPAIACLAYNSIVGEANSNGLLPSTTFPRASCSWRCHCSSVWVFVDRLLWKDKTCPARYLERHIYIYIYIYIYIVIVNINIAVITVVIVIVMCECVPYIELIVGDAAGNCTLQWKSMQCRADTWLTTSAAVSAATLAHADLCDIAMT